MRFMVGRENAVLKPPCQDETNRFPTQIPAVTIPRMDNRDILARIEKRLKMLGLSAQAASVAAGLSKDAIRNWQRKPETMPVTRSLMALAPVLETSVEWLLGEIDDETAPTGPAGIRYGGIVEAGAFRPWDELNQEAELRTVPLAPDPRYPAAAQSAFEVIGDSMTLARIEPGMWVQAVDLNVWEKLHGSPRDGLLVIVANTRDGEPQRELTVKRLRIYRDRLELVPESANQRHRPLVFPYPPRPAEGCGAEIIAVVLSAHWLFS